MLSKILMPSGGQTTDEMTILKWNRQVGDTVARGDILFEIETDKAILTVESFAEGKLLDIRYEEGATVKVGEIVAWIGNDEDARALEKNTAQENGIKEQKKAPAAVEETTSSHKSQNNQPDKILASPLARSLARIENVDLKEVSRYTSGKPIKKSDVSSFIAMNKRSVSEALQETDHYFIEMTAIRRTIAKRMKESVSTAPHYHISIDVDMTASIALRNKLNSRNGNNRISFNDLLMKVVANAIPLSPLINARFEESRIKVYRDVHIGLAVATETGIVVPVVRDVNRKPLSEIAVINRDNVEKVKSNRLSESDLHGGTITISNLGMLGVDWFTAIINQPESCILAVGSISKKPVVVGSELVIRDMMNITASFDHRVIDGAIGAAFLKQVKELLEEPELLIY